MRRFGFVGTVAVAVFAAGLLLGTAGTLVVQAHGGDASLVHGCAGPTGDLRVVGASETCRPNETALDWNIQGPAGPPGPQGPAGPEGPQGPAGVLGFYRVGSGEVLVPGGSFQFVDVSCDPGDVALSGGWRLKADGTEITNNAPSNIAPETWGFHVRNTSATQEQIFFYARCADLN